MAGWRGRRRVAACADWALVGEGGWATGATRDLTRARKQRLLMPHYRFSGTSFLVTLFATCTGAAAASASPRFACVL
jgi:hypothetical protein